MLKRDFSSGMFRRIFSWLKYRDRRSLSDHRATNLAVRLTLAGQLTPYRPIHSRPRR